MSERSRLSGNCEEKREGSSPWNLSGWEESGNFRRGDIGLRPSTRNRSSQWGPHSGQGQSIEEGCLPQEGEEGKKEGRKALNNPSWRIVFFGPPSFALPSLETLTKGFDDALSGVPRP